MVMLSSSSLYFKAKTCIPNTWLIQVKLCLGNPHFWEVVMGGQSLIQEKFSKYIQLSFPYLQEVSKNISISNLQLRIHLVLQ